MKDADQLAPNRPGRRVGGACIALALASVTACGDDGGEAATSVVATAESDDGAGTSAPVAAGTELTRSVLVLDEIAGLGVVSLGIIPASVDPTFGYDGAIGLFESLGVEIGAPPPADGRGLESILAADPSAIVGTAIPTTVELVPELEEVAPTLAVDFTASWQEQIRAVAALFAAEAEAERVIGRVQGDIDALAAELQAAGLAGSSVSVLAGTSDGATFAPGRDGMVGGLLRELGLTRPAAQDVSPPAQAPFVDVSAERLEDHDADALILLTGSSYDDTAITGSPLYPTLRAVQAGAVDEVLAEVWFTTSAFGMDWLLQDLRAALLDDGEVGTLDDIETRFEAFRA